MLDMENIGGIVEFDTDSVETYILNIETIKEVDPHPRIAPCVNMWSVTKRQRDECWALGSARWKEKLWRCKHSVSALKVALLRLETICLQLASVFFVGGSVVGLSEEKVLGKRGQ